MLLTASLTNCGVQKLRVHATGLQTFLKLVENTYNGGGDDPMPVSLRNRWVEIRASVENSQPSVFRCGF